MGDGYGSADVLRLLGYTGFLVGNSEIYPRGRASNGVSDGILPCTSL